MPKCVATSCEHTLVRGIESELFDSRDVGWNGKARVMPGHGPVSFVVAQRGLPSRLPNGWRASESVAGRVRIDVSEEAEILLPVTRALDVSAAGQLPTGFDPKSPYPGLGKRKFWMPLYSRIEYTMKAGKTIDCERWVYVVGICIARWQIFVPD